MATRDIILLQKREIEQRLSERYVPRETQLPANTGDLITVVLGPRRAGKSSFAAHLVSESGSFGYANFDDERLSAVEDYDEIVVALNEVYRNPKTLFLDEVQNLPRWELFVNRLQRQGMRLIVTGSNAQLLGSERATHLTGRHLPVVLFPFSFNEYLRARGGELTTAERVAALRTYVEQGGYPEPLIKGMPPHDYLTTLLRAILYKDILVRHHLRSAQSLQDLTTYLMANLAREFSYRTLCEVTRCRSTHTVDKYLRYLEEAFIFFEVRRFSYKVKEQLRLPRKIYCIDNGLISSSSFRFSPGTGTLYENLVAIALRKRAMEGKLELFTWRSAQHEEVDFVVKEGLTVTSLIQVCVDVRDPKTLQRETRALIRASPELRCENLIVLTEEEEREEELSWFGRSGVVRFVPLWRWLVSAGV